MTTLLLLGSPRKNGNTALLFKQIILGIEQTRQKWELIRLAELDIHPCIGCGNCEKTGNCIFNDDMQELYLKISKANRIIIGSPIYFYNVTAQTKLFIDRCQTLWSRKYVLQEKISKLDNRQGFLVSVAATSGERIFEGARLTARYAFDAMDCRYSDELLLRGLDKQGQVADHSKKLQQAEKFGTAIARA